MFIDYLTNPLCDFMIHLISIHFDFLKWKKNSIPPISAFSAKAHLNEVEKNEIFAYPYIS